MLQLCSQWIMYANMLENFMKIERSDLGSDPRHNIQTIKVSSKIETQFIFIPVARGNRANTGNSHSRVSGEM